MYLSSYAEEQFLNVMRGQNFAAPSQMYAGLFLSNPTDSGTSGIELAYDTYQRMPIVFNSPTPENLGIGIRNSAQIDFAASPIATGTVTHCGIFDAISGGNMYMYGELSEPMTIAQDERPVLLINEVLFFGVGDLSISYKTKLFNVMRGISLAGVTPYLSLWNGDPEVSGSELAGLNYARVPLGFSAPVVNNNGHSTIASNQAVAFNRPSSLWGLWSNTVIMDSIVGGAPIWKQARAAYAITKGKMPEVDVGAITIGIN